jgi:hypothetical protein
MPCARLMGIALLLAGLVGAGAQPAQAQGCLGGCPPLPQAQEPHSDWQGHLTVLGVNAALGGLTAGLRQHARGGSFWRGFATGAAGGGVIYGGKWLSAEEFWGAGLAGRQVAAVGSSLVRNASEGRAAFEYLMVPIGPVRLYVDRGATPTAHFKLDLLGAGVLAYHALSSDARFDGGASFSAGTAVFHTQVVPRPEWHGSNIAGVIVLRDPEGNPPATHFPPDMVFAHERIHLLQYDQALHMWGAPFEQWLLPRVPGGAWLARHVDLGLIVVPVVLMNSVTTYESRPWEREAHFFSGSHEHRLIGGRVRSSGSGTD